jgi:hypothetical protein
VETPAGTKLSERTSRMRIAPLVLSGVSTRQSNAMVRHKLSKLLDKFASWDFEEEMIF